MNQAAVPDGHGAREFLQLAGHPVRWRLLEELARSDRKVGELTVLLGEPQSLVSYHLGRLRSDGLVSARRSSADRRDWYYSVDLNRFAGQLALAARSLHRGLRLTAGPTPMSWPSRGERPVRLLFLCTGNGARSQVAQALAERRGGSRVQAYSAGSSPKPLHPNAIRAMREREIDISARRPKHLSLFAEDRFDYVITLCDRVREVCPEFPGHPGYIHWSIPDPAASGADDRATLPLFRHMAAELETRVTYLLAGAGSLPGRAA